MKKKTLFVLAMLALLVCAVLPVQAADVAPVSTDCASYIVMDPSTGQVLLEKNADQVLYPASITKIMILGLACEKAQNDWDTLITVGEEEIYSMERQAAHIALRPGEEVRLEDMLYATCLQSACDAANVLAVYVGGDGTIQSGVDAMNAKARELGLVNTHFANPTGLQDEGLYSTARDMAVITQWALQQPGFAEVFCRTKTWIMEPTNIQENQRYFYCDDHLRLGGYQIFRSYAKGSKSGWHDEAQYTQSTYAEQDGIELVCVTMRSTTRDTKYSDIANILDYCYEHFRRQSVAVESADAEIEVWGGSGKLGKLTLTAPQTVELLVADGLRPDSLKTELEIPERYVLGAAFSPSAAVTLEGGGRQSDARFSVPLQVSGLEALLSANTYTRTLSVNEHRQLGVSLALALVVGLGLIIWLRTRGGRRGAKAVPALRNKRPMEVQTALRRPGADPRDVYRGRDGYSGRSYNSPPRSPNRRG